MLAHTFRGTTWRSMFGLEEDRDVFQRYRAIRRRERHYVDWPDPLEPGVKSGAGQRGATSEATRPA